MVKAVFFDLYNTIAGFQPRREEVQAIAARDLGLDLEPAGLLRGYVDADHLMTQQNARRHIAKMTSVERRAFFTEYERLVLRGAGVEASDELADRVWTRVREIPYHLELFEDSLPALRALKGAALIVGVISNIYQDLTALCDRLGMSRYLDIVVSSQSAGAQKPHPKIFEVALDKAGVGPGDAVHIGDQYNGDVTGARGVGIRPVLLDRDGLLTYDDVDKVRGLDELPALLGVRST